MSLTMFKHALLTHNPSHFHPFIVDNTMHVDFGRSVQLHAASGLSDDYSSAPGGIYG